MSIRRGYPCDLSDEQWALIEPTLTAWRRERDARDPVGVRPRADLREVWNAIVYVNRSGCQWSLLPHDFPNFNTVLTYYYAWRNEGILKQLNAELVAFERVRQGRDPEPTAAVMDTQSIKTAVTVPARDQGADPGKKIVGRKRGLITDVLGLILAVSITAANVADNHHANTLLAEAKAAHPGISAGFVDQGFKKQAVDNAAKIGVRLVTTVGLATGTPGFTPAQKRWVVERSIGTLMLKRRLTRDHEKQPQSSAAQIYIAQITMLTRRLTGQTVPSWRGC